MNSVETKIYIYDNHPGIIIDTPQILLQIKLKTLVLGKLLAIRLTYIFAIDIHMFSVQLQIH